MRLDRFSMILYIAFPVIGSICSVVMITHFVWIVQDGLEDNAYSSALFYVDMARDLDFFGLSHLSYRIVVPLMVGSFTNFFGITSLESIALIYGTFNFAFIIFGLGVMLKIAIQEQGINVFELILPALLVILMPFFLTSAFYPIIDAGVFLCFSVILLTIYYRNLPMLFLATFISVWVSEVTLLALLIVPAMNFIRNENWWQAYIPFLVAFTAYIFVVGIFSPDLKEHYLFNTKIWAQTISANFVEIDQYFFVKLLPTFGLILPFIAYRLYHNRKQRVFQVTLLLLMVYYLIFLLTSPENTPQLMFMTLPMLIFLNFHDKTIIKDYTGNQRSYL